MFALESAMDELARRLRCRPGRAADPQRAGGRSRERPARSAAGNLVACLREGAARFGWGGATPRPRRGGRRVAASAPAWPASTYPANEPALAGERPRDGRRALRGRRSPPPTSAPARGPRWPRSPRDALGVPTRRVRVELGDSALPDGDRSPAARWAPHRGAGDRRRLPRLREQLGRRRCRPTACTPQADTTEELDRRSGALPARVRRPVRRGAGRHRHRRGPRAAAARRVRGRPDRQPADGALAVPRRHDDGARRWRCTRRA